MTPHLIEEWQQCGMPPLEKVTAEGIPLEAIEHDVDEYGFAVLSGDHANNVISGADDA